MPVLLEMASLVAPAPALRRALGVEAGAAAALGAEAAASDGELTALSFRSLWALRRGVERLERAGLDLFRRAGLDDEPGDLAAVDQRRGPLGWWPWLELAMTAGPGGRPVLAARRAGDGSREVAVPAGWRFEGSASAAHGPCALALADRPLRHLRREPGGDLYLDRWTGEEVRLPRAHAPVPLRLEGPGGVRAAVTAEPAARPEEIEVGLMFREALAPDEGMLFRFGRPGRHQFWMKNTLVPLDLLFVRDGRVVDVAAQAAPRSPRHHGPDAPVQEVLEVPGGWCEAHGIGPGATLRVDGEPVTSASR